MISSTDTPRTKAREWAIFRMSCPVAAVAALSAAIIAWVNQYDTRPAFSGTLVVGGEKWHLPFQLE